MPMDYPSFPKSSVWLPCWLLYLLDCAEVLGTACHGFCRAKAWFVAASYLPPL